MDKLDYDLLGSLSIKETGFLSSTSSELIKFLSDNGIYRVSDFLRRIDNNSFMVTAYMDTLNEARGLAGIFKNKYFGYPISASIYLDSKISELSFVLPNGKIKMAGIKGNLKEKTTIYTAFNRLGFNCIERNIILSRYENRIIGRTLIDIFNDIINDSCGQNLEIYDRVFYDKMLFYVNYYKHRADMIIKLEAQENIENLMRELSQLLQEKSELDKQIEIIMNKKNELDVQIKEINDDIKVLDEMIRRPIK